ncbi:MAG: oxidoreductase, partial [Patescibacteria group bacterium]|nr:oxidoreductase [Patescibacteria group bacterium]
KTIYVLTNTSSIPASWTGETGRITKDLIAKKIPDYKERFFYLSGPHAMIVEFEQTLKKMGVTSSHIKKDFFPGFV